MVPVSANVCLRFELESSKASKDAVEAAALARDVAAAEREEQAQTAISSVKQQLQELQEDRESFEMFHNAKLEAALEEVKKRAAAAEAAAIEVSALKSHTQTLQEQLAAATGDSAVIAERCDALQQQLQARAPRCSVVTCDVTIDARLSRWRWQSWRT
jgi:hypothetical protein